MGYKFEVHGTKVLGQVGQSAQYEKVTRAKAIKEGKSESTIR